MPFESIGGKMNPSQRISSIIDYVRSNGADSEEICGLLDIVVDEFKAVEQRDEKTRIRIKKNLKNISKYLATQAG